MNEIIQYRCKTCGKSFFLLEEEVEHSEQENRYITCPYNGRHKYIVVTDKYANLKEIRELMEEGAVFKKSQGRWVQV